MKNLVIVIGTTVLTTACLFSGIAIGKNYSTNPTIVTYHKQSIIMEEGDVMCPDGDMCQWIPFDISTGLPLRGKLPTVVKTGDATAKGAHSVANTGSGNTVTYGADTQ